MNQNFEARVNRVQKGLGTTSGQFAKVVNKEQDAVLPINDEASTWVSYADRDADLFTSMLDRDASTAVTADSTRLGLRLIESTARTRCGDDDVYAVFTDDGALCGLRIMDANRDAIDVTHLVDERHGEGTFERVAQRAHRRYVNQVAGAAMYTSTEACFDEWETKYYRDEEYEGKPTNRQFLANPGSTIQGAKSTLQAMDVLSDVAVVTGREMDHDVTMNQIGFWNLAACGARKDTLVVSPDRSAFAMKCNRDWLVVQLEGSDTYAITRARIARDGSVKIVESHDDLYDHNVGVSVYGMFNK